MSILDLAARRSRGGPPGLTSVCSAHPLVIEAALLQAREDGTDALIEATCNQVNPDGGYTGLTPEAFRTLVHGIADSVGVDRARVILGGDHLGPNPWRHRPAAEAMDRAKTMVAAYVAAGFTKLHLDTSMGCAGEPEALADGETARRAAALAAVAEEAAGGFGPPSCCYVIGTEVPVPGGATHALHDLAVTSPEAARETVAVHRAAFARLGLQGAFERVIAAVVQPGVEFGNDNVIRFRPERSLALSGVLQDLPALVFEAHSTDYQPASCLRALVEQGFAILKVGPGLSFALREALYGLDAIADVLAPGHERNRLFAAMDEVMLANPVHWQRYGAGSPAMQRLQRHFSYSDRIRYYWADARAQAAVGDLMSRLGSRAIPETLVSQFLSPLYPAVASGAFDATPRALLIGAIRKALDPYSAACVPPVATRAAELARRD